MTKIHASVGRIFPVSIACLLILGVGCAKAPDSPEILLERARILMDRGQGAEAVPFLDGAVEAMPDNPEAYYQRGLAYENLDLHEKALDDYVACLKLDSRRTDALNNKAVQLAKLKRFDEAIAAFSELVDLNRDDFLGYRNRGLCRFDVQDYAGALQDYATAVKLNPADSSSWFQRGNVYLATSALEAAESDYSKAVELDPRFAKAWMNRGVVRYRMGEKTSASEDLTRAQELDNNIVLPGIDFFRDADPATSATEVVTAGVWDSCRLLIEKDLGERGFSSLVFVREFPDLHCAELTGAIDGQARTVLVTCQQQGQTSVTLPCPDVSGETGGPQPSFSLLVLRLSRKSDAVAEVAQFEQEWHPDADDGKPVIMNYNL
jgi:tetratricopeptide (TPR) repeat protein